MKMLSLGCVPFQFAHATRANATSKQKNKRVCFNTKLILYRHSLYICTMTQKHCAYYKAIALKTFTRITFNIK